MQVQIQTTDVYAIALHHRFQWEEAQQCYVILFPEGMVKLNGGAGEVLKRINGQASVAEIVADLTTTFPDAPNIEVDIMGMLDLAVGKAWLRKI
ncbi:MAG: pyrroloquinoline quinone biosynthesis peptide chaperone PqqD [Methylophilaceae bacterium]